MREELRRQPRLMVTPTTGRLIHWIGLQAGDEEVAKQGRELSRGIGGNFYAPKHRTRLIHLYMAMVNGLSSAKINPKSTLMGYIGRLIDDFGWR